MVSSKKKVAKVAVTGVRTAEGAYASEEADDEGEERTKAAAEEDINGQFGDVAAGVHQDR